MQPILSGLALLVLCSMPLAGDAASLPPAVARPVDFAKEVRPIFLANCYQCHGPDKQKSAFRLDIKAATLKGGEQGLDIIPGQSSESRLIRFVAGLVDDMQMPPKGEKLTAEQIGILRAWIDQGAIWPDGIDAVPSKPKNEYWTFQPAVRPAVPTMKLKPWVRNEIDAFILQRLEKENLTSSPEADKRTLIRRLSFNLLGLPPTPEEIDQFLADNRADAYEKLVDRLLNSPRYGERWARHWLDTVHFGETHGYDKDKTRPNAWPYRDYVIRSFNDDKPYSRFVEEQLAGDALFPDDPDGVVATGFIAAGPWDFVGHAELPESKTDGLIARYNDRDDMVMTTMSTFQSLTVHCARCHDHKFDPISQEDYYRLQAVFAGVDRADRPFDPDKETFHRRKSLQQEKKTLESRQKELNDKITQASPEIWRLTEARRDELSKQLAVLPKPSDGDRASPEKSPSNGYHSQIESSRDRTKWVQIDLGQIRALDEIRLVPARPTDFPDTPGFGFPMRWELVIADDAEFERPKRLADYTQADFANPGGKPVIVPGQAQRARYVRVTATRLWERTGDYLFALGELQVFSAGENVAFGASVRAFDSIESGRWAMKYLVDGFTSRTRLEDFADLAKLASKRQPLERELQQLDHERQQWIERLLDEATKSEMARVNRRLSEVATNLAALPPVKMVYAAAHDFAINGNFKPAPEPRPIHLLKRGEVIQPGPTVEPGALSCLPGLTAEFALANPADESSRRAALAKWITNRMNLLTRRSIVNRIWHYHFGRGLVDSPNDFGHIGSMPTHPELLDWLAFWFLENGESIKQLHKLILTSSTYRQSSAHQPTFARIDGDNRYLWRMNRARLDAESLHDTILWVSGKLNLTMGGPSVQQFFFKDDHSPVYDYTRFNVESPGAFRRSIYRFIVRSVPDPFMETLDCADPALLTPKRNTTVTALQALALLNNPFVLRQAEYFAERLAQSGSSVEGQIDAAYRLALGHSPRAEEWEKLAAYARQHGMANVCRLIFNSSEFMFVD
jgi:hypothetical protein